MEFPIQLATTAESNLAQRQRNELLPQVRDILRLYRERQDVRLPRDLRNALRRLASHGVDVDPMLEQIAMLFDQNNLAQLSAEAPGIAFSRSSEKLMRQYIQRNVKYIKALDNTVKDQITDIAERAFVDRVPEERLRDLLLDRVRVSESHAKLIARDQTNKLFGDLTKHRQLDAGIKKYRWKTSQDERVRERHRDRHNTVYYWSKPPAGGHPGHPIRCRCTASPFLT